MFNKNLIAIFLLILLVGRISIAQEAQFMHINAGELAKFTGYLFSPEAITKIYTSCKEDVEEKELECTADINSLQLDIEKIKELHIVEIKTKDKLYNEMIILKNNEILAREKLLNNLEEERLRNKIFVAGSFIAGILLTTSVFYIATGFMK